MSLSEDGKIVETLAWITDDEAEFWTNTKPLQENTPYKSKSNVSESKKISSCAQLPDGDYFKFGHLLEKNSREKIEDANKDDQKNEKSNTSIKSEGQIKETNQKNDMKESLTSSLKVNHQTKENTAEIFDIDQDIYSKAKEIYDKNIEFFSQLFNKLKPTPLTQTQSLDHEEGYTHIDSNEIIKTNNINLENQMTNLMSPDKFLSFFDDLAEETDVIMGALNQETFLSRRIRKAKTSRTSINNNYYYFT